MHNQRIVTAGLSPRQLKPHKKFDVIECSVETIGAALRRDDFVVIREEDVERIRTYVHWKIAMNHCQCISHDRLG